MLRLLTFISLLSPSVGFAKDVCFKLENMSCGACENSIQSAAKAIGGVNQAEASADKGWAKVKFDEKKTDVKAIKAAIEAKGYPASVVGCSS